MTSLATLSPLAAPEVLGAPTDAAQAASTNASPIARASGSPAGVGAVSDTIQAPSANVAVTDESIGFCSELRDRIFFFFEACSLLYLLILDFFLFICSLGNYSLEPEETLVLGPTEAQELETRQAQRSLFFLEEENRIEPRQARFRALQKALFMGFCREVIVRVFEDFPSEEQEEIKLEMWNLAEGSRANAGDWAGRVIRGDVRLPDETEVRADIQQHTDITAHRSLLSVALNNVIYRGAALREA